MADWAGIYNTGTATVANEGTTVTLHAAGPVVQALRPGDRFGAHVGLGIRITEVEAGELTLAQPWPGPSQTEEPYEIALTPYDSGYRQKLNELLSGFRAEGLNFDVQVADLTARGAYDTQAAGFIVLVSDIGDGRAALYSKVSEDSGDWSEPGYVTGATTDVLIEPVVVADYGTAPSVSATPTPEGMEIEFTLPGSPTIEVGSTTTTAPGTDADVTVTTVTGGIELDFEIPAGSGFYWGGEYDGGETYPKDTVVRSAGSSWIALQESTGNAPPTLPTTSNAYWELLATRGSDGLGTVTALSSGDGISIDSTDPTEPVVQIDLMTLDEIS